MSLAFFFAAAVSRPKLNNKSNDFIDISYQIANGIYYRVVSSYDCRMLKHQQRNGHTLRSHTFLHSNQRAFVCEPTRKPKP